MPITSGQKVVRALEKIGFTQVGTRGDHVKLRRDSRRVIVPLHKEIKRGTMTSIPTQAGLSADELRELL
ncbi:putative RNA binding protein YcfA (HicA-like mRNA interferase family) [Nocardiopsis mwathae]|uniref:Putative RNA binding protein YcfA (HicA-like mRNA interferase family) n=1 Tax=Nocardiopsis mwathae TaxID=1472723 RepID=A0A7X0D699_9ACTN|nr:type II toxin-antitoxin system HicA family toxin [Nocardiopsis mwathae]MBB6173088.1 putative RNA binding protein YcfA (HicA-like mRNA interferase family) [Nocardiopsis mwathae]